jgi:hypothetical protein
MMVKGFIVGASQMRRRIATPLRSVIDPLSPVFTA